MYKKVTISEHLTNFLLCLLYSGSVFYMFLSSSTLKIPLPTSITLVFLCVIIFYLLFINKYVFRIIIYGVSIIIASAVVYILISDGFEGLTSILFNIYSDLFYLITSASNFSPDEAILICAILCAFFAAYSVIFIVKSTNFLILSFLGILMYVMQIVTNNLKSEFPYIWFALVICILAVKHIYNKYNKNGASLIPSHNFIFFLFPVIAVIISAAIFLPFRSDYNVIYDLRYYNMNSYYNNGEGDFSLARSGFGDNDSKLGGPIKLDDTNVLVVETDRPYYISGKIKDTYDGKAWTTSTDYKEKHNDEPLYDTLLTLRALTTYDEILKGNIIPELDDLTSSYAEEENPYDPDNLLGEVTDAGPINSLIEENGEMHIYDPNGTLIYAYPLNKPDPSQLLTPFDFNAEPLNERDILKASSIKSSSIKLTNLNLRTVLHHSKVFDFSFPNNYTIWSDKLGSFYSNRYMPNNFQFSFSYLDIDKDIYERILRSDFYSSSIINSPLSTVHAYKNTLPLDFIINDASFARNNAYVEQNCYTLPEVPYRIYNLSQYVTQNYKNPYEKALALEKFLTTFYNYTLEGKVPPENQDFVDYFLFDNKEGYCTYFASAMAVMARCIGLPSRYVEGFVINSSKKNDGTYVVSNSSAHSWPEIYFEGIGWIPFEPTAGYSSISTSIEDNHPAASPFQPESPNQDKDNDSEGKTNSVFMFIFIFLLIFTVIFIIYCILRYFYKTYKINKITTMTSNKSVIAYFKEICLLLEYNCTPVPLSKTMFAFAKDNAKLYSFGDYNLMTACEIFDKASYSDKIIFGSEVSYVKAFYDNLKSSTINKTGKLNFFFKYYIKLIKNKNKSLF